MVMGFKSRALILQGQLEASQHECEQLRAQLEQRQQDREQSVGPLDKRNGTPPSPKSHICTLSAGAQSALNCANCSHRSCLAE